MLRPSQVRSNSVLFGFVLLGALLLCACSPESESAGGRRPATVPEVAVVTIQPQRTVLKLELPGRTRPYAESEVRPQVNGILQQRLYVEGSRVEAGQPLYQIDDTLYRAELASVKAQLANAQAALNIAKIKADRYESLRHEKSISQQDYDDAQAAVQQARADVAEEQASVTIADINLGYTRIIAPISGRISRSYLTQGALVTANQSQALATIQTLDPIYVDINQSSNELLRMRNSAGSVQDTTADDTARVTLTLDDGTAYPLEGTLQFSEVVVDQTTGTVTLRAEFPNPEAMLLPGMFVRATVVAGVVPEALLVPQRGVSRDNRGNPTALILDSQGVVRQRALTVSQTVGSSWLVTNGIEPGDRVIVEGLQFVHEGVSATAVPFGASSTPGTELSRSDEATD